MMIRSMSRAVLTAMLTALVACGGASKPAAEPSSGSSSANSSEEPAKQSAKGDAKSDSDKAGDGNTNEKGTPNTNEASPEDKAKIADGLQLLDKRSLSLEFDLNLMKKGEGKGVQSGNWSFAEERTMRVKAAKKDVIGEMQVVYGKWEAKPLLGLTYEMPTDGKTYLLTYKDGALGIVRGSNEKLSSDEQQAVKAEYGWVGARSPLRTALLDSGLKSGAELPKTAELAQILLGEIPGASAGQTEVTATLDKVESGPRKKAILKLSAKTEVKSNKTTFELELKGTASVDVTTGWVLGADLAGTVSAKGSVKHPKQGELEVSGKGKVTLTRSSEFR